MTRRVFLHIGLPKTGTTYLQDVVWANKDLLAERGLLIPGRHRRRHLLASLDLRDDPKLARRSGDITAPWQDLVDEAVGWDGDVVISHEFFGAAAPEHVRRACDSFPDAELHVILTARDLVTLGTSYWQEWVKNGGDLSIDDWPERADYDPTDEWGWGAFDLAEILERWGSVVEPSRIHVLPVAVGRAEPGELWRRFASVVGVDPDGLEIPEEPSNRSLGLVEAELLRRVNARLEDFSSAGNRGRWIRGYLAMGRVIPASGEKFRPGTRMLEELQRRARRSIEMLQERQFDLVGDLSLLEPVELGDLRHPGEVPDGEILDLAAQAIANLMTEVRSLTRAREALEMKPPEPEPRVSVPKFFRRSTWRRGRR
ncbi:MULTISPECIES: hypothetical protein [unclassified Nocardioides]|uniref:hypothetical protein n=1 Tax=unclassified Nocardioides TaxID=2615069 RepID=UPI0007005562|nr:MULTISPECIES: hypothetical protein [unclassified Nocardioides]KQY56244.1 hypothetical protein ASD30_07760 [Nocardioides sp. Root140]KRF10563.1 hypothetical protein ASH02_20960 [Nocardioides sp. Soil796]